MADPASIRILQTVRTAHGRPIVITSGYRHPTHLGGGEAEEGAG